MRYIGKFVGFVTLLALSLTGTARSQLLMNGADTWLLVYRQQSDHAKGQAIVNFLKRALTDGQKDAAPLNYAPLPEAVVNKELKALKQIAVPAS